MAKAATERKKRCDHKNVGVLVYRKNGKLLLVERMKKPYGWSPPTIHVDGDGENFRAAAQRAVSEKVGLAASKFVLLLKRTCENKCRRRGGKWHNLRVFKAFGWRGNVKRSVTETKDAKWVSQSKVRSLAGLTEAFLKGKISARAWRKNPGLEVVWYKIFKNLGMI